MADTPVSVRGAAHGDIERLVELNELLFREDAGSHDPQMNLDWPREHGAAYFAANLTAERRVCLAAVRGAAVAGYLTGYVSKPGDFFAFRTATVESLFVAPEHRRCGAASALLREFRGWALARGARRISVTAYAANRGALALYRASGFHDHELTLLVRLPE